MVSHWQRSYKAELRATRLVFQHFAVVPGDCRGGLGGQGVANTVMQASSCTRVLANQGLISRSPPRIAPVILPTMNREAVYPKGNWVVYASSIRKVDFAGALRPPKGRWRIGPYIKRTVRGNGTRIKRYYRALGFFTIQPATSMPMRQPEALDHAACAKLCKEEYNEHVQPAACSGVKLI